jgi:hypothetical protein
MRYTIDGMVYKTRKEANQHRMKLIRKMIIELASQVVGNFLNGLVVGIGFWLAYKIIT